MGTTKIKNVDKAASWRVPGEQID